MIPAVLTLLDSDGTGIMKASAVTSTAVTVTFDFGDVRMPKTAEFVARVPRTQPLGDVRVPKTFDRPTRMS